MSKLKIYSNQRKAALKIYDLLLNGKETLFLVAEPQSGKTGAVVKALCWYKNEVESEGKTFIFIYDIGLSSRVVLEENYNDFKKYNNSSLIQVMLGRKAWHLPNNNVKGDVDDTSDMIKKLKKKLGKLEDKGIKDKGVVIVLVRDEADFAAKHESNQDKLLRQLGELSSHDDIDVQTLFVTATPEPLVAAAQSKKYNANQFVYMEPGTGYYGFKQAYADGRIQDSFSINDERIRFLDIAMDYKKEFDSNPKHFVIRLNNGADKDAALDVFKELGIDVELFSCKGAPERPIAEFSTELLWPPEDPTVLVIDRSYTAGARLSPQCCRNIWVWFDAQFKTSEAAAIQSSARPLGYEKDEFKFKIYTNVQAVEMQIKQYDKFEDLDSLRKTDKHLKSLPILNSTTTKRIGASTQTEKIIWRFVDNASKDEDWKSSKNLSEQPAGINLSARKADRRFVDAIEKWSQDLGQPLRFGVGGQHDNANYLVVKVADDPNASSYYKKAKGGMGHYSKGEHSILFKRQVEKITSTTGIKHTSLHAEEPEQPPEKRVSTPAPSSTKRDFYLKVNGRAPYRAEAVIDVSNRKAKVLVKKGSTARSDISPNNHLSEGASKRRNALIDDGTLVPDTTTTGKLIFNKDCIFESYSQAAQIINAGQINARVSWRDETGERLKSFQ